MSKCRHQSVEITETTIVRTIYTVIDGCPTSTGKMPRPEPSEFHVRCRTCGYEHTYKYGPGKFSHWSKPYWLYDHMSLIKYGHVGMEHIERDNKAKRAKKGKSNDRQSNDS